MESPASFDIAYEQFLETVKDYVKEMELVREGASICDQCGVELALFETNRGMLCHGCYRKPLVGSIR